MSLKIAFRLSPTIGLCAGVVLEFFPPVTAAQHFTKDKYLEPMFGDVGQASNQSLDMQNCRYLQPQAAIAQNLLCWWLAFGEG